MIPKILYSFIFVQLIAVSYGDIRYKKIPNLYSILNLILFILFFFIYPKFYVFSWSLFVYPLSFLGVGFILFLLNIMGGGDAKYLFSLFLLVPLIVQDLLFYHLLISTIIIASLLLLSNSVQNFDKLVNSIKIKDIKGIKDIYGSKFAFAPVILIAWILLGWEIKIFTMN